jgi:hypothetical protein
MILSYVASVKSDFSTLGPANPAWFPINEYNC